MPRSSTATPGLRDAFTYSPGDHHRYVWDGRVPGTIAVERIRTGTAGRLTFEPTGDMIEVPAGTLRTATALGALVDSWAGPS